MPYSIIVAAFHCVPFSITNICVWGGLQYYYFLFYFDPFLLQLHGLMRTCMSYATLRSSLSLNGALEIVKPSTIVNLAQLNIFANIRVFGNSLIPTIREILYRVILVSR